MFKAFDAAPASINFSEVYSALQTKIVEGQENPLAIISTAKLYEVQKYCSLTNHMWDGFWFLANRRAWEKVPDDMRAIVAKNINAAGMKEREDVAKLNASLRQNWTARASPSMSRTRRRSATNCGRPGSTRNGRANTATRPGSCWRIRRQAVVTWMQTLRIAGASMAHAELSASDR